MQNKITRDVRKWLYNKGLVSRLSREEEKQDTVEDIRPYTDIEEMRHWIEYWKRRLRIEGEKVKSDPQYIIFTRRLKNSEIYQVFKKNI